MTKRLAAVVLVALASQGCFASKSDFEALRTDVGGVHRHEAVSDSVQRAQSAQLASIGRAIAAIADSIHSLNSRLTLSASELSGLRQDIARLQDITGQSEQRMKEIRATLEERAPTVTSDSSAPTGPGPAQLLQLGRDQMIKRSYTAGRSALNDLLSRFPTSDLAPDAIYEIAQSYRAENNLNAADSTYGDLTSRFPDSSRAPSALYKRALILQSLGRQAEARKLFEDIRRRFPRSPEASLAQERLGGAR
ncbi:MAG: tetratricopeptide repeat protein [Gemmatimonadota bacterium]|nr:tetratricopeptide repeat protein [Gemmatimonadota bacterium]